MNGVVIAWNIARRMPTFLVRALTWTVAMWAWLFRRKPVVRLEENLHKVTGVSGSRLRTLSRRGMASTARYYAEMFELPKLSVDVINARARIVNQSAGDDVMDRDGTAVFVLSHSGNWDLTGAWAAANWGTVTSVAEVLKPKEVYDEFINFRKSIGINILGHEGSSTFRELIRIAKSDGKVMALLADRDMSGSGIEVSMWGRGVRVAPGPAALSIATGLALIPLRVYSERLYGAYRRAAKSRWGIVIEVGDPIEIPDVPRNEKVQVMSQQWATFLAAGIEAHPEDWHVLQRFGWAS